MERRGNREERGSRRRYEYQPRSKDDWEKRKEKSSGGLRDEFLDGISVFKPHAQNNRIRILPPTWELMHGVSKHSHYGIDIYVHYKIGADNSPYLCNKSMTKIAQEFGIPIPPDDWCPICEERTDAFKSDEVYAKTLFPSRRVLIALIDRDDEKSGVQFWAAPAEKIDAAIAVSAARHNILNLDDPDAGFDIEFDYEPPAKETPGQYKAVEIARRSTPLGNDEWLEYVLTHSLPTALKYYPSEHIAKVFAGRKPESDTIESESQTPGSPSGGASVNEPGSDKLSKLTYDDIQNMRRGTIEDLAIDDLKFSEAEVQRLSDDLLRDEICKELRLTPSRETSTEHSAPNENSDDRIAGLRNRYKRD